MLSLLFDSGIFKVSVKHLWQKREGNVLYYRRRYPEHYRELMRKQGKELPVFKVVSLKTKNKAEAARKIVTLATRDDREWEAASKGLPSSAVKAEAVELIRSLGLIPAPLDKQPNPEQAELAWDNYFDEFERQVERKAQGQPRYEYEQLDYSEYLSPAQRAAIDMVSGNYKFHLSDAKDHYIKTRTLNRKGLNDTDAAFRLVTDALGDKPIEDYRRAEVTTAIDEALTAGLKTATVSKRLGTVRAAVSELIRDEELDIRNPFEKHRIRGKGEDVDERSSLSQEQMDRLRVYVREKDNTTANMLGILVDTGARVSEVAGLMREDVKLDDAVPHLVIHANPMRRLKTKDSRRRVPLVGDALLAARRALDESQGLYLFPRYMSDEGLKNDSASAAMRKVTQTLDCHTPHWLRHTMRTRLKNVNAPETLINEIGGWSRVSVAQSYGQQTALQLMQEVMEKSLTAVLD